MNMNQAENIDQYIAGFQKEIRKMLNDMRATIQKAAPKAEEAIKYGMPTFVFHGNLVHFAAFKNHIGFYPAPQAIIEFNKELSSYHSSKGAIQFPLDKPLPLSLVAKIVKFRVAMNLEKAKSK